MKVWFSDTEKNRILKGMIAEIGFEGMPHTLPKEHIPYYVQFDGYESMYILENNLFYSLEKATVFLLEQKTQLKESLLKEDQWIKKLFESYFDAKDQLENLEEIVMKEIIKEKLGIKL